MTSWDAFITWIKAKWAAILAYLARGGSDDQGTP